MRSTSLRAFPLLALLACASSRGRLDTSPPRETAAPACDGGDPAGCEEDASARDVEQSAPADAAPVAVAEPDASTPLVVSAPTAAATAQAACDRGDPAMCNQLALRLQEGAGVPRSDARAVTLFESACTAGYAFACTNLGSAYENGRGVRRDLNRARGFYRSACDHGDQGACPWASPAPR